MVGDPLQDLPAEVRRYIDQMIEARAEFARAQGDREGYARAKIELAPHLGVPDPAMGNGSLVRVARKQARAKRRKRSPQSIAARNRQIIHECFEQVIGDAAAAPSHIREMVRQSKGVEISFTQIRRALEILEKDRVLERVGDQKLWRLPRSDGEIVHDLR